MRELQAAKGGTICGRETWPVILPINADFHDTVYGVYSADNLSCDYMMVEQGQTLEKCDTGSTYIILSSMN